MLLAFIWNFYGILTVQQTGFCGICSGIRYFMGIALDLHGIYIGFDVIFI
jgi:hypothetical protein